MHRAIPVGNKILDEKWHKLQYERLQKRISESRGVMFASVPPSSRGSPLPVNQAHPLSPIRVIINRAKRDQLVEDRYTEIEKENRRLLEKMTGMLKNKKKTLLQNQFMTRQNFDAANMTSDQIQKIFNQSAQTSPRPASPMSNSQQGYKKSLNRDLRKRQLQKISEENQAFLQRLQETKPIIQSSKIESQYNKKIPVLKNMCEFPYILGKSQRNWGSQRSTFSPLSQPSTTDSQGPFSYRSIALNHYGQVGIVQQWCQTSQMAVNQERSRDQQQSKRVTTSTTHASPRNFLAGLFQRPSVTQTIKSPVSLEQRQADGLDQNRVVHFKKGKYVKGGYFIIEISTSITNLFIAAFDVESPASFLISIPFPKAQEVIDMFEQNFDTMANYLSFSKNKLVMLNPNLMKKQVMSEAQESEITANVPPNINPSHLRAQTTSYNSQMDQNQSLFSKQYNLQKNNLIQEPRHAPWSSNDTRVKASPRGQEIFFQTEDNRANSKIQQPNIDGQSYSADDEKMKSIDPTPPMNIADTQSPINLENGQSPIDNSFIAEQKMSVQQNYQQVSNHTTIEIDAEIEKLRQM